jgi:hypothetical protein
MPLWMIRLLDEKATTIVSGSSRTGEADVFGVHRWLRADISSALLAVGMSERSSEGRPFSFDPWVAPADRRGNRGGPSLRALVCSVLRRLGRPPRVLSGSRVAGGASVAVGHFRM